MNSVGFVSEEHNFREIEEFLREYFLHSEGNEGYRYFSRNSISIDYDNREITFAMNTHEKTL